MFFKIVLGKEIHVMNPKQKTTLAQLKEFIKNVFKKLPSKYMLSYVDSQGDQIALGNQNDVNILHQSGLKSVKIYIEEASEDFFDETEQVAIQTQEYLQHETKVEEEKKVEEVIQELPKEQEKCSRIELNESSISQISNLQETIQEKVRKLMPTLISQIKSEISREESFVRQEDSKKQPQIKMQERIIHDGVTCDGCGVYPIEGIRYKCSVRSNFDLCEKCQATREEKYPFLKIRNPKQAPYKIFCIINDEHDNLEINGESMNIPGLHQGLNMFSQFFNGWGHGHGHGHEHRHRQGEEKSQRCKAWKEMKKKWKEQYEEQKSEQKVEVKVQQKKEVPVVIQKPKVEEKREEVIKPQNKQPIVVPEVKIAQRSQEQNVIENANHLAEVLDLDFTKCYKFAVANLEKTKQQLIDLYFAKGGRM